METCAAEFKRQSFAPIGLQIAENSFALYLEPNRFDLCVYAANCSDNCTRFNYSAERLILLISALESICMRFEKHYTQTHPAVVQENYNLIDIFLVKSVFGQNAS